MKRKKRKRIKSEKREPVKCNKWKGGYCMAWAKEYQALMVCPLARAQNLSPGECCHHPAFS